MKSATIKAQRLARKQRKRLLHNGVAFVPAKDLIHRRLHSKTIEFHTPFAGERETRRRGKQLVEGKLRFKHDSLTE
jgi:hypothetical protein